jgi:hypothetical protein
MRRDLHLGGEEDAHDRHGAQEAQVQHQQEDVEPCPSESAALQNKPLHPKPLHPMEKSNLP